MCSPYILHGKIKLNELTGAINVRHKMLHANKTASDTPQE